ncbi:hypothetical protein [Frigidibacter sp. ROC022]|uniref:hypothetical protein n=1 Tax=Frigidibacter sp. ROC022 TaxID=2971796 RepID=UPI00215A5356|nr:hypothetical protein [Frigidibacter sp. ROC022]MCR8723871.1 hypothetical protein [Frigidibacter sp. ROC022]
MRWGLILILTSLPLHAEVWAPGQPPSWIVTSGDGEPEDPGLLEPPERPNADEAWVCDLRTICDEMLCTPNADYAWERMIARQGTDWWVFDYPGGEGARVEPLSAPDAIRHGAVLALRAAAPSPDAPEAVTYLRPDLRALVTTVMPEGEPLISSSWGRCEKITG